MNSILKILFMTSTITLLGCSKPLKIEVESLSGVFATSSEEPNSKSETVYEFTPEFRFIYKSHVVSEGAEVVEEGTGTYGIMNGVVTAGADYTRQIKGQQPIERMLTVEFKKEGDDLLLISKEELDLDKLSEYGEHVQTYSSPIRVSRKK